MIKDKSPVRIFDYNHAAEWLIALFEEKRAKNHRYSQRSFAKFLNVSHTVLNRFLRGETLLSPDNIQRISAALKFTSNEDIYLNELNKPNNEEHISLLRVEFTTKKKPINHSSNILTWRSIVLLELLEIEAIQHSEIDQLARTLRIDPTEVSSLLLNLLNEGILSHSHGSYYRTDKRLVFEPSAEEKSIHSIFQKYYAEILDEAKYNLRTSEAHERFVGTETLVFNSEDLPKAQKILDEALHKISLLSDKNSNSPHIYQCLSIFFKIANGKEKQKNNLLRLTAN